MNTLEAWKNFVNSGSPLRYIEYSQLKFREENNAKDKQGPDNKGNGY